MSKYVKTSPKKFSFSRFAFRRGDAVPKFHYEVRSFSKVIICSDLTDNELEFAVVQGINLNVAKDAHTYCRYVVLCLLRYVNATRWIS